MNNKVYDVIIVGAGPGGLYTAYGLTKIFNSQKKILIVDAGNDLDHRKCPIIIGQCKKCCQCNPCNIMQVVQGHLVTSSIILQITLVVLLQKR